MKLDFSNERVEWEVLRVVTAFEMQECTYHHADVVWHCGGRMGQKYLSWQLSTQTLRLTSLSIVERGVRRTFAYFYPGFGMRSGGNDALLARGLYRLGIEHPNLSRLLATLSAHEKVELHLSMPREFWPQKWLDEENYQRSARNQYGE